MTIAQRTPAGSVPAERHSAGSETAALRRRALAGVALALLVGLTAATARVATGRFWIDLEVYRDTATSVLNGRSPYEFVNHNGLMYNYTPFAALLLTPLGLFGLATDILSWTVATMVALQGCVWVVLGHLGIAGQRRAELTLAATFAVLPMLPILHTLELGQINIMLMLLVLADLIRGPGPAGGPAQRRWQGVGVGIAAGIKLTPLVFIPYLLLTGRIRAAVTATAAFAATVALGFAVLPAASATYWSEHFQDSGRLSPPYTEIYNQSLRGGLVRLSASGVELPGWVWPVLALVAAAAGMAVAVRASRRGAELAGVLACALTALLVSPISWHTHWVWCVPLALLLVHRAWLTRRRGPAVSAALVWLVFVGSGSWVVVELLGGLPRLDFRSWPTFLLGNLYLLLAPMLLVLLARRTDPPAGSPIIPTEEGRQPCPSSSR